MGISLGTFLALDDLYNRLASCESFFSFDPAQDGKPQWGGGLCFWTFKGGTARPRSRFFDYESVSYNEGAPQIEGEGSFLSMFYEVIPLDQERREMATVMMDIGIMWILMHEEGHYADGHLLWGQSTAGLSSSNQVIHETLRPESDHLLPEVQKVLEWQADRVAAEFVMDVYYCRECADMLPGYTGRGEKWLFRLIIVAIGAVILILQKARLIAGSADYYPSPRTRLIALTHIAIGMASTRSRLFEDSPLVLLEALVGAFDDLYVASRLITREGDLRPGWKVGLPPLLEDTQDLSFFGSENEATAVAQAVFRTCVPAMGDLGGSEVETASEEWQSELRAIVSLHDDKLHEQLRRYRVMSGYNRD